MSLASFFSSIGTLSAATWLSGVVSAFIIQFLVRSFVTRAEGVHARINDFCDSVNTLSSSSHVYWSMEADNEGLHKAEAELSAANHTMTCYAGIVYDLKPQIKEKLSSSVFELQNEATGHNFQVQGRAADPYRYRAVQARAIVIIGELRRFQQKFWVRTIG